MIKDIINFLTTERLSCIIVIVILSFVICKSKFIYIREKGKNIHTLIYGYDYNDFFDKPDKSGKLTNEYKKE